MNLNNRIREFIADTEAIVTLPDMDQSNGVWDDCVNEKCCFGARIARALCKPTTYNNIKVYRFDAGKNKMLKRLNLYPEALYGILYACGTGTTRPFDEIDWENDPTTVYQNLMKIERKPTVKEVHDLILFWEAYELPSSSDFVQAIYQALCEPE